MTPEERVANLDIVCGECSEYHCLCLNCAAKIAQALREHGNEKLEEVAIEYDAEDSIYESEAIAKYLRSMKDEEKP